MVYIVKNSTNDAVICYDESIAKELGEDYLSIEESEIPAEDSTKPLLKTDGKTLWREAIPAETEPELTEDQKKVKLLEAQLAASAARTDFMEDCIAEMATVVYS